MEFNRKEKDFPVCYMKFFTLVSVNICKALDGCFKDKLPACHDKVLDMNNKNETKVEVLVINNMVMSYKYLNGSLGG